MDDRMKLYNIANDFSVLVSVIKNETSSTVMLEYHGDFSAKSLSVAKTLVVLDNAAIVKKAIEYLVMGGRTEKIFQVAGDSDIAIIARYWAEQKIGMLTLHTSPNPKFNKQVSVNFVMHLLKYEKEIRSIIQENTANVIQKDETTKAKKDLAKNSANLPTDKKSAKSSDVPTVVSSVKSFAQWMLSLNIPSITTEEDTEDYLEDTDAIQAYQKYLASVKRVPFSQLVSPKEETKKSFKQLTDDKEPSKAEITARKRAKANNTDKKANGGKRVPISFVVKTVANDKVTKEKIVADGWTDAYDVVLQGKRLANLLDSKKESKLIVERPHGTTSARHYVDDLVRQGYITELKRL